MNVKKIANILNLLALGIIFPGTLYATSLSKITGFNLKTCVDKSCLELKAESVQSGQFSPLQTLKNYKAYFNIGGKSQQLDGKFGYIDFEANTVVLKKKASGEILVNLNTLQMEEFP